MVSNIFSIFGVTHDLDGLKDVNFYPPDRSLGKLIRKGLEFEVLEYGRDWVPKKGIHPHANTLGQLKQDKADYDFFKNYIAENLPQTFHFRAVDKSGQENNFILQTKIGGRHLCELSDQKVQGSALKKNLLEFLVGVERMWREAGRVPDLCKKEGAGGVNFLDDVRYGRNVIVDENNKVWLVDTSANPLVFSKQAKLRYKYVPHILMCSVKRFKSRLIK